VTLTFAPDGSFVVDLANDPDWLLLRLEPFAVESGIAGRPRAASNQPLTIDARDALLARFAPVVIDRVVLWIDGREVRPESAEFIRPRTQTSADDLSPLGTYRLRGRMPTDVRSLRWFYGIVIDPYPLTIRRADGRELKETILGKAWSESLDLAGQFERPSRFRIVARYLAIGFDEALTTGFDHALFVVGLLFLSLRLRPIALQLATFVIAQWIGVGLTMYDIIALPSRMVWPIVVLSIIYVVAEDLLTKQLTPWRLSLIVVFGFFHGAEVANALQAVGAPPARLLSATLSFTAGVVGGELSVLAASWLLVAAINGRLLSAALSRPSARG
jgi:HupE / UreJ protein